FDERHIYILSEKNALAVNTGEGKFKSYRDDKSFHVSPFNDMQGQYDFVFADIEKTLDIRINIRREGRIVFYSRLWGNPRPLDSTNIGLTIARYPLTAVLSMPRILWQAAKLHYLKRLPVFKKPHPSSPLTIKVAHPRVSEKLAMKMVLKFFTQIKKGLLTIK